MRYSTKWKHWITMPDEKTCKPCKSNHGKIYEITETPDPSPPLHINCRCVIERMKSLFAGSATDMGSDGADWYLKYKGVLPDYYIDKAKAKKSGWISYIGNLEKIAPGQMIFGGIYYNDDKRLPTSNNRIWYEADINYTGGHRNTQRIVYSNDGLIFVTYDHYETFIEIR